MKRFFQTFFGLLPITIKAGRNIKRLEEEDRLNLITGTQEAIPVLVEIQEHTGPKGDKILEDIIQASEILAPALQKLIEYKQRGEITGSRVLEALEAIAQVIRMQVEDDIEALEKFDQFMEKFLAAARKVTT